MKTWIRVGAPLVIVVALGLIGVSQWSASADDWACDRQSACVRTVALDLASAGLEDPWIAWKSFDLSPDGAQIVVGLQSVNGDDSESLLLGTFSTETGELITTLVRRQSVAFASADEAAFSPDGTLIAAVTYDTGGRLQIFDAVSGEVIASVIENDDAQVLGCSGRLGISPANDFVQCGSAVFEIPSGDVVETIDERSPYASSRGGSFAWSSSGLVADGFRSPGIDIRGASPDSPAQASVEIEPLLRSDRSLISFADSADGGERLVVLQDARSWQFWSRDPRRTHPGARVSVFSVTTGEMEWSVDLADRTADVAANGTGLVAAISEDARVTIFEVG